MRIPFASWPASLHHSTANRFSTASTSSRPGMTPCRSDISATRALPKYHWTEGATLRAKRPDITFAQFGLLHLSHGVARQFRNDINPFGKLELRETLRQRGDHCLLV